jgi:hypothetical protein
MKNLVEVEPKINGHAGATKDNKGKIIEYLWFLKKEGYAESTFIRNVRLLKTLTKRGGNLLDSESIKLVIAEQQNWKATTKEHAVTAYTCFLRMHGKE